MFVGPQQHVHACMHASLAYTALFTAAYYSTCRYYIIRIISGVCMHASMHTPECMQFVHTPESTTRVDIYTSLHFSLHMNKHTSRV